MADFSLLRTLFATFGVNVEPSDWNKMAGQKAELLTALKDTLPTINKDRLESTLKRIHTLACPEGMQAISDAFDSPLPDDYYYLIQTDAGPYTRSLYVCLNEPDVFQKALTLMKMFDATWSNRLIRLPRVTPSVSSETISLLESDIESICANYKEKGTVCSVECYEKEGIFYYYARPDDYPEDILIHDENKNLIHKIIRKTFTMAFSYDSVNGVCQISTRGCQAMKEELQDIFLIDILGRLPRKSEVAPFNLSLFLHPNFSLVPEPGELMTIRIRSITLSHDAQSRVTIHPLPNRSLWSEMLRCSNREYLSADTVRVDQVELTFVFLTPDQRKIKTVSFALRPLQCTLKDETDPYSKKIIQFLKRRRIANDELSITPVKSMQFI